MFKTLNSSYIYTQVHTVDILDDKQDLYKKVLYLYSVHLLSYFVFFSFSTPEIFIPLKILAQAGTGIYNELYCRVGIFHNNPN